MSWKPEDFDLLWVFDEHEENLVKRLKLVKFYFPALFELAFWGFYLAVGIHTFQELRVLYILSVAWRMYLNWTNITWRKEEVPKDKLKQT